jgi:predicted aspartyl protease
MIIVARRLLPRPLAADGCRVQVRVGHPQFADTHPQWSESVPALVDTGATLSYVPLPMARRLRLTQVGTTTTATATQRRVVTPVYLASIEIDGVLYSLKHHVAALDVPFVLLGRWTLRRGAFQYDGAHGDFSLRLTPEDPTQPLPYPPGIE